MSTAQSGMFGAALMLARRRFGGDVVARQASALVGTSAGEALGGDPERVQVLFVNLSANDIYLGFNSQVSATNGIWLGPNGGSALLTADEDGPMPTYAWWAVATVAASTLHIVELRRESIAPP